MNLALNARQAMHDRGTLVIEAVPCRERAHRDCISLSVADTGCGMDPEVADRAFQPFFSTRLASGGTGLGLFNVRTFVEKLGGMVELSTEKGRATRITPHLPVIGDFPRS